MLRYLDLIQNPRRFLALTGYTVDEFQALLSFFRVRFQAYVARFTLEGKPRQNRTYSTYKGSVQYACKLFVRQASLARWERRFSQPTGNSSTEPNR
jgi:hypothetical protein